MKNSIFLLLLPGFICISSLLFSQDKKVTFVVNTPGMDSSSSLFITGNDDKLGQWNASFVPLRKMGKEKWEITISFNQDQLIEFKFTRGSWEMEALSENGTVPANYSLKVINDTTLNFTIRNWKNKLNRQINGQITGNVKYHYNFTGEGILPRDIIVWLPPGYEDDSTLTYPVLYAHDGQNLFNPATSSFGYDWQLDETSDSLIKAGLISPVIIVGIYNTSDRSEEYLNSAAGKKYIDFIIKKLKPFIDSVYRTKTGRENTATLGSSSGGLISFMLAWEYPEVFSKAACFSPAFHPEGSRINYIPEVVKNKPVMPMKIYIYNGGTGIEKKLQTGVDEMISLLKSFGYTEGNEYRYVTDPSAAHNEQAWSRRVSDMLIYFYCN